MSNEDHEDVPRLMNGRDTLKKFLAGRQQALLQLAEGPHKRSWVAGDELRALGDSPAHVKGSRVKSEVMRVTAVEEKQFDELSRTDVHALGARDHQQVAARWDNARAGTTYASHLNPRVYVVTLTLSNNDHPATIGSWRNPS